VNSDTHKNTVWYKICGLSPADTGFSRHRCQRQNTCRSRTVSFCYSGHCKSITYTILFIGYAPSGFESMAWHVSYMAGQMFLYLLDETHIEINLYVQHRGLYITPFVNEWVTPQFPWWRKAVFRGKCLGRRISFHSRNCVFGVKYKLRLKK
jgi:hypothetical protein